MQEVEQASSILGPALAGAMISLLGLGVSFGANAVLFLFSTPMFAALAHGEPFDRKRGGWERGGPG